ncbi:MAG: T9SS type A sorting domain-containing protein, partial [Flavobacteriaceae bacterium]|nr:T9SS type A sorting domain-containing protein [Flavobacteriaceae bacterium]
YIGEIGRYENGKSFVQLDDGNFIVAGGVGSGSERNSYLVKIDEEANINWDMEYETPLSSQANFVGETTDNNIYFVERIIGDSSKLYLTDASGNVIWTQTYFDVTYDEVAETSDGGYVLIGEQEVEPDNTDIVLTKTNDLGVVSWTQTFGGPGMDGAGSVLQLSDDGFIIAAYYDEQIPDQYFRTYLIRTDDQGNEIWSTMLALYSPGHIIECCGGNGYVFSTTWVELFESKLYFGIQKIDLSGNIIFNKLYRGVQGNGQCVIETQDSGFLLTGSTQGAGGLPSDMRLIKFDSAGNTTLSTGEIDEISTVLSILPNPAVDFVILRLDETYQGTIEAVRLYNSMSQKIINQERISSKEKVLDLTILSNGIYFVDIITSLGDTLTHKLIISK